MITYCYGANTILARSLRSRKGSELLEIIKGINQYLELREHKPNHQILDNESSTALKDYLNTHNMSFQFVPPHMCLRNAAERATRSFKTHFIKIMCGNHPEFPLCLWCKIFTQVEITLNMMRPCRSNPKLSAYSSLEVECSHNHTPLAPLGAKVISFDSPTTRQTCSPYGHYAQSIGPALDHCRCFKIFNQKWNNNCTNLLLVRI